ncbi:MAG: hypothetical protein K5888_04615 [Lachnospiraceae bacterium]|nr:hypothetical protein [Lachnospiraceae bacterium]
MEERERSRTNSLYIILTAVAGIVLTAASAFLYGFSVDNVAGIAIAYGIMLIAVLFVVERQRLYDRLIFDNSEHIWRFYLVYAIGFLASVFFPLISENGRPFLVIFVALVMVSDEIVAICAGSSLLVLCELLCREHSINSLIGYFVPSLIAVMFFSVVTEEFRIFVPLAVSIFAQFVSLCVISVLFSNRTFGIDLFLIPFANIFICVILILVVLKVLSFSYVYKKDDRYMDILDPEFELLSELKNRSKDDYDHSIYTSVLCSKLALKMGLDEKTTKALGLYHRIGLLRGDNNWENAYGLMTEHNIPEEVIDLLAEYFNKDGGVRSRQTAVLVIAETVVSSVGYLFSKDKEVNINYEKLINTIFDKKLESGMFADSDLSFSDINIMKKTLCEEKLFYDFLR